MIMILFINNIIMIYYFYPTLVWRSTMCMKSAKYWEVGNARAGTQVEQGTKATVPVPSPAKVFRGNHEESWIKCWTLQHHSLMKREKGKDWMNIHLRTPAKCWKWQNLFLKKSASPLRAVLPCLLLCQGHSGDNNSLMILGSFSESS